MDLSPDTILQSAWAVWFISWLAAARWSSPTASRSGRLAAYRLITAIGAMFLFGVHPFWPSAETLLWHSGPIVEWTLVLVGLCGFAFTWWARIALGRLWSGGVTRKIDHFIVTSGPYRLVRHPIYTGIILAAMVTAMIRGTVGACLGAAAMALGLFIKARVEEGFLRRELGEEQYDAYARRVPMLVPFTTL